ncbi:MAG: excinuclease ABC subunit UvrA [Thermoguttaceae bacterium]|nr:excinuclease ABC subunit UvrA [Thermoguttaceae bacterium]MDW8039148.1 excinuclease ABC subunit UvrA [Thermoguttaceae bacterium]
MPEERVIRLRGVRVHNLKGINLDIPHRKLVVLCGLSGSGKSSLALDTLYAEGQRRYIESFSAYTRQFLERLEKPDADAIDGIPPSIAVTAKQPPRSSRSTVATATEIADYLRLLYAKIGQVFCQDCGQPILPHNPRTVADVVKQLPPGRRLIITFGLRLENHISGEKQTPGQVGQAFLPLAAALQQQGFIRLILGNRTIDLSAQNPETLQEIFAAEWSNRLHQPSESPGEISPTCEASVQPETIASLESQAPWIYVIVDRLTTGQTSGSRLLDSLETAFDRGQGSCWLFVEQPDTGVGEQLDSVKNGGALAVTPAASSLARREASIQPEPLCSQEVASAEFSPTPRSQEGELSAGLAKCRPSSCPHEAQEESLFGQKGLVKDRLRAFSGSPRDDRGVVVWLDARPWRRMGFASDWICLDCSRRYLPPEPRLFSFNHPWGACPTCEGFGNIIDVDMDLVVPDPKKSLREGAIAPWNCPAYAHELEELLRLAPRYGIPTDVPFGELKPEHLDKIIHGIPERGFGGLDGFFAWLERKKYKMHIRVFLSRWRSARPCPACQGARFRPEALAVRIGGINIAELMALKVSDALRFFRQLQLSDWQRQVARTVLAQIQARLEYLEAVGLGYLTLDRTLRTLSGGEMRRVALSSALGSSLVNMLYVLDEPSVGLHPRDIQRLVQVLHRLRDRGNTVVVVEHEEAIIRAADHVIEIGPGAGERGGRIVFQGTPQQMEQCPDSLTGDYLAGRRGISLPARRRSPQHGWIRLVGARGHNLKNITVEFPLGVLCVVTGVSGSGKSTLVQDTLYPALCRRLHKEAPKPCPYDDLLGDGQIDDCVLVDQTPIGRTPRSNPVTYLKAFDEIRQVFADTLEARTRNISASHFSFNVDGGRCPHCQGEGYIEIDMQFLADVFMKCPQCGGTRYRDDILQITYRGRNIAEVLEMTVREAFTFFRGHPKVQARLKRLLDVGLDYLRLGQPANTLSGGEAQRLKLAGYISWAKRGRCLFILDEPTTGLHFADVVQLLDCFDALLSVGHSLIVVEHNLQIIKSADWIIDLGPGAAEEGGEVVAKGTPEMVARNPRSLTGRFLADLLAKEQTPPQGAIT